MYRLSGDELTLFDRHAGAIPLYEAFAVGLFARFPATDLRAQKTQITFSNRHVYACVSLAQVKKKAELPDPYLVITLGLPYALASRRVAVKSEPYPGWWTTHIVVGAQAQLDDELWEWVRQAYEFAERK